MKFKISIDSLNNFRKDIYLKRIFLISIISTLIFYLLAVLRHYLLQSNAFDLGLFDQWIWLTSQNLPSYSSMTGLHMFADHGAWILYIPSLIYKIMPDLNILFLSQSISLCFTAIPLYFLCKRKELNSKISFLITLFWLLQPVVFNINLFDFHPEVWSMPLIVLYYYFEPNKKFIKSIICTFLILGTRDGLVLLIFGFGLEQIFKKRFRRSLILISISILWFLFLNNWIYPLLNGSKGSVMALARYSKFGDTFGEILFTLITKPSYVLNNIDLNGSLFYLLILFAPAFIFWKRISLVTLISALPLIITNILSDSSSQRTLIHQYSLPIVIIIVIAVINGVSKNKENFVHERKRFLWMLLCWAALAKPTFFIGPYLTRLDSIKPAKEALAAIPPNSNVITTSYLVPHLSQRVLIKYPNKINHMKLDLDNYNILLLNPLDPGWDSSKTLQEQYLKMAEQYKWKCLKWENGLELCKK